MGGRAALRYQNAGGIRDKRKREERLELNRKKKAKKRQEEYAAARLPDMRTRGDKSAYGRSVKHPVKKNGRLSDLQSSSDEDDEEADEEVEAEEEEEEKAEEEEEEEEGDEEEEDEEEEEEGEDDEGEEEDEDEEVELSDGCLDESFGEEESDEAEDSEGDDGQGESGSRRGHARTTDPVDGNPVAHERNQGEDLAVASEGEKNKVQKNRETAAQKRQCAYVKHNALLHTQTAWGDLPLSRPLLRAIQDLEYAHPTHIQAACLRPALEGRDLLANAQTGSGKTAAFLLPTLERLLHSPGVRTRKMTPNGPAGGLRGTKALVLLPTRELAMQCVQMLQCLSKYTPVTHALACGGMTLKAHENALRQQPDIVVATPGRILDLLLNSPTVHLELLEIIVLDEADRLLELGFREEILAILRHCHRARQTLLFSATLTPSIASLASLALNRPLHISAEAAVGDSTADREKSGFTVTSLQAATAALKQVSSTLEQQFVMLQRDEHRAPALLHLCTTAYTKNVIVFFQTKQLAHQTSLLFKFMGLQYAELHGNLTQQMRVEALERFHAGEADFLLASELASRGLDIAGVEAVINFNVPADIDRYIHSVGRTARMGRSGVAVTLYHRDGPERLQVKKLLQALRGGLNQSGEKPGKSRNSKGKGDTAQDGSSAGAPRVFQRRIDADKLEALEKKVKSLQGDISRELKREKLEREVRLAELHLQKAENLQTHADEIYSRPMRQWFMTAKEKQRLKDESKALVGKDAEEREALEKARGGSAKERSGQAASEDEAEEDSEAETEDAEDNRSLSGSDEDMHGADSDEELPDWITACSDDGQSVEDEVEEPAPKKKKAKAVTVKEFKVAKPKAQPTGGHKEKKKQERLTPKQRERMKELQFMKAAGRSAKRSQMPKRLRVTHTSPEDVHSGKARRQKNQKKKHRPCWRAEESKKPQGGRDEKKERKVKSVGKKAFKSKGRYRRR
ncbi:putative DEAD/DEAH box RNA helicase [Neospora caninum Liverpool]|uniref:DEAD/DEAH box RNA helicase, putative n=1 Tax=Neospora caninum (strain Liverpool) TaxID=572307 RepID=F0VPQ7_NEOCL|nr:putative DEAD/DEAH box RNA helicase [Neospora caninum Liverpool]CBZ55704.1 putative DEAD/DEAH box RNA helicase [Neospora caninum Liverpool]CEL70446.1 TPA: DEAD/DEAH box RNA helicase, putative [Neospora caninum Liverpool]|eukprot:XP_003885730.1 putative DEAD/DEAH box RNA helicase [Neospora caninum Liverpool]